MKTGNAILFMTHAEVQIDPAVPVTQWGLSDIGMSRHRAFNPYLSTLGVARIHCSAEQKAIEGAMIIASHCQMDYQVDHELHENDRCSTGYLPPEEFERTADEFFAHPQKSIRGWETACDAQARIVLAIKKIEENHTTAGNLIIVSHGGVGALLLSYLQSLPISRALDQPGTGGGNYFMFERDSHHLIQGWTRI